MYVEVPRILISGSNFPFIPPVEFLEIFHYFCIRTFRTLVTICAKMHTFNLMLYVFDEILYYTFSFTKF